MFGVAGVLGLVWLIFRPRDEPNAVFTLSLLIVAAGAVVYGLVSLIVNEREFDRGMEADALMDSHWGPFAIVQDGPEPPGVGPDLPVPLHGYAVIDHDGHEPAYLWVGGLARDAMPPARVTPCWSVSRLAASWGRSRSRRRPVR